MPIKVACACGAAFAAKDELAGRTVACPKCKQPLKIPAATAQPTGTVKPAAAPAAPAAAHVNAGAFDDLGLKARDMNVARCPGCGAEMPPNAVLCVKCGFNTKTGKRLQTVSMSGGDPAVGGGGGGHAGHGDATAMLMARAAQAAEEDAIAEKSKTSTGAPLWILAAGLFCCILFGIVMSLIPQHVALMGTAYLLALVAGFLSLYALVGIWIAASKKMIFLGPALFFGDLVLGILLWVLAAVIFWASEGSFGGEIRIFAGTCSITYAMMNAETCGMFMFYMWVAKILLIVAYVLAFIGWLVMPTENVSQLPPVHDQTPVVVRMVDWQPDVAITIR